MKQNKLACVVTFLIGGVVASVGWYSYVQEIFLESNEQRYFDLALQLKWHVHTLQALRKNDINSAEKYQVKLIDTLLIMLDHYGQDKTTKIYAEKIKEIVDEARRIQQKD